MSATSRHQSPSGKRTLLAPEVRPSTCSEEEPTQPVPVMFSWLFLATAQGDPLMAKNEQTGKKAGTAASKTLRDGRTSKDSKTAAGSALSQRPDKKK